METGLGWPVGKHNMTSSHPQSKEAPLRLGPQSRSLFLLLIVHVTRVGHNVSFRTTSEEKKIPLPTSHLSSSQGNVHGALGGTEESTGDKGLCLQLPQLLKVPAATCCGAAVPGDSQSAAGGRGSPRDSSERGCGPSSISGACQKLPSRLQRIQRCVLTSPPGRQCPRRSASSVAVNGVSVSPARWRESSVDIALPDRRTDCPPGDDIPG